MTAGAAGPRRARLLVSVAAVGVLTTVVLLVLLVVALVSGRQAVAAAYGLAATVTVAGAAGLLTLSRAGALATDDLRLARRLCTRCAVGALFTSVGVLVAGGVAVLLTGSGTPMVGAALGPVLGVPLAGVAARQRVLQDRRAARIAAWTAATRVPPPRRGRGRVPPPRSGGGRESERGRARRAR